MIKRLWMLIVSVSFIAFSFLIGQASADTLNPTYDFDIAPGEFDIAPIPGTTNFDVDIVITSDIPVNMYVVTQAQLTELQMNGTLKAYEEKYEDVTSKTFNYQGKEAGTDWVVIMNEEGEVTANVHIEMKVFQEAGEEVANACCGSTILVGTAILLGVVAILYILKRR
jgi:hypothetical protein